jgi:hypothetical protein
MRPALAMALVAVVIYCAGTLPDALGQQEAAPPGAVSGEVNKELIDAAHKLTTAEAGKYHFTLQDAPRSSPKLRAEPVLRWSNPAVGEVHGNVFLWTIGERPVVIGSLFKWFTPHTHMSHEFHSLAEAPLVGRYDGADAWTAAEPGVKFVPLPVAPPPAGTAPQRLLQMKRLVKDFAATKTERDGSKQELRLLTQPIYRYAAPDNQIADGSLFVMVQGTDPEIFLLLEARGAAGKETWYFAPARMNSVQFELRYQDREVWRAETLASRDVYGHAQPYTSFFIKMPEAASP